MSQIAIPETLTKILIEEFGAKPDANSETLLHSIGMDSLDAVELAMCIEEDFGVALSDEVIQSMIDDPSKTIGDLVKVIENGSR